MKSFGTLIREYRIARGLLLREVAAILQIDPSFLSRIENDTKRPTREHVVLLARALRAREKELMIAYLSDKISYELEGEEFAIKAMLVAEKKIRYKKSKSQVISTTNNHETQQTHHGEDTREA